MENKKKVIERPLFPSYIFANTCEHELFKIAKLRQIVFCLSTSGKSTVLEDKEIEAIKQLLAITNSINNESKFSKGDKVRVINSAFAGFEGVLLRRKSKTRFGIHFKKTNRTVCININTSIIELIDRQQVELN